MAKPELVYIEFIDNSGNRQSMTYKQCASMMLKLKRHEGNSLSAIQGRWRKRRITGNTNRQCVGLDEPNRLPTVKIVKKTDLSLVNSFLRKGLIPIKW